MVPAGADNNDHHIFLHTTAMKSAAFRLPTTEHNLKLNFALPSPLPDTLDCDYYTVYLDIPSNHHKCDHTLS
jgi:hypothetical protein